MSGDKFTASARVVVSIEVDLATTWGPTCPVDQIYKQAIEGAAGAVFKQIKDNPNMRVVGKPRVTAVMTTKEVE